ncbi:MAG: alginate lyase family protein [Gammaproteobacteria bacterium]|nr:alginate lyase family protein [Gammaproteobacteria bacterium]
MIRPQTADRSRQRWQANLCSDRAFVAGVPAAAPSSALLCQRAAAATGARADRTVASFAIDALRLTDRGAIIEQASRQMLSNPTFTGAIAGNPGVLPNGWRLSGSTTSEVLSVSTINGLPAVRARFTLNNNSAVAATVTLNLESSAGVPINASRVASFSGNAVVESAVNAGTFSARLVVRNAQGVSAADQGRQDLALGAATSFTCTPAVDADATAFFPSVTWGVPANSIGVVVLTLYGLQLEPGVLATSFIPFTPSTESAENFYPNTPLAGVVSGTPGTLPTHWSQSTMTSYQVGPTNADGSFDLTLTATAGASDATLGIRLNVPPPGGPAGLIPVTPGETWEGSIEAQLLSDTGSSPRLNVTARTSAGATIAGFNSSTNFPASVGLARTRVRLSNLPATAAGLMLVILLTAPAGTTRSCTLRLRAPRADRITVIPGTSADRPLDVVRFADPALFSGASEVTVDAECTALDADATLLSLAFGTHRVRLVAGGQVGVVVTPSSGPSVSALRPCFAVPGVIRLALSYQAGQVSVAFSDACKGESATLAVPGFDPSTCSNAWLGSDNGATPMTTAVRSVEINSGATAAADLRPLARRRWSPQHFVQLASGFLGPDIEAMPVYTPASLVITGNSATYPTNAGNRAIYRSNGGVSMTDALPDATTVGSVEGTPFRMQVVNADATASITIVSQGGLIYPPGGTVPYTLAPVSAVVIPPGHRAVFCSDGFSPAVSDWVPNNENWWFAPRADSPATLSSAYGFSSIYGPSSPSNPNRSIIFPPAFCAYQADIGPLRALAGACTQRMNRWIYYGTVTDAAITLRYLRDACASGYWATSLNITADTSLKSQINQTGFAYLGVRDAPIGRPADHLAIREWFRTRMDAQIAFFDQQIGAGRLSPGIWASTSIGRGNHVQQAALASGVCACILDRADYLRWGWKVFLDTLQDAADVPGHVGALPLEMRRAQKSLQYQSLALGALVPHALILERFGYPAFSALGGMLIEMINWTVDAIDNPSRVTAEQARMISLGAPWDTGVVSVTQEPLGLGVSIDPNTGERLLNEGRAGWIYGAFQFLTDAQAPWRPRWRPNFEIYNDIYAGSIGGAQSYLYPFPGIARPAPPEI